MYVILLEDAGLQEISLSVNQGTHNILFHMTYRERTDV